MGELIEQELVPVEMMDAREFIRKIYIGTIDARYDERTMHYIFIDDDYNKIEVEPAVYKLIVDCLEGRIDLDE